MTATAPALGSRGEPSPGQLLPGVQPGRRPPARSTPVTGHLYQLDVVRLLTFAAVIAVHSLAFTEEPDNRVAAGAMMLLQFGREVFFTLTAFVLVYSAGTRVQRLGRFWGRRIAYVAVPYVVWSAIYYSYSVLGPQHLRPSVSAFALDLLYGGAMYHLYFLLVTLQLYVVFPAVAALVRRTASRAVWVLVPVTAANLAWLAVVQWVPAPAGAWSWWWVHAYELLPTYSMYVLAGCYAAVHLERLQRFFDRNRPALLGIAALCAAAAVAAYMAQLPSMAPRLAAAVLQPATTLSCAAALIVVYLIGSRWAAGPRRMAGTVAVLSDLSFGVYLAHPLVLQILLDHWLGNGRQAIPAWTATVLGFVCAVAGGAAIAFLARRTPLSLALTGRPFRRSPLRRTAPSGRTADRDSQPMLTRFYWPAQLRREGTPT